ncbi:MAG: hypothetical protein ACYTEV_04055 [Planctomycetota bacterium]
MRVLIDESPCDATATTVQEALAAAAARAEACGRLIVEVMVDGTPWGSDELGSEACCGRTADEVRLTSIDRRELVSTTLGDAAEALARIDEGQRAAAESLQSGDTAGGMGRLAECLHLWLMVQEAVDMSLRAMDLRIDSVEHEGRPVSECIGELQQKLRGVRDALAGRDTVALADTLLYELPSVIEWWRAVLGTVQRTVRTSPAATGTDGSPAGSISGPNEDDAP